MARVECPEVVQDDAGNVQADVPVTITLRGTSTLAQVFAASVGGSAIAQPFNTDQQGRILAYVDPGSYDIDTPVSPLQEWEAVSGQSTVASSGFLATAKWLVD